MESESTLSEKDLEKLAPDRRRKGERRSDKEQLVEAFRFPGIANLAVALDELAANRSRPGRRPCYPARALLSVAVAARAYGAECRVLKALQDQDTWEACRRAYQTMTGEWLPTTAPERGHLRHLRRVITTDKEAMKALNAAFTTAAVRQAIQLGNLAPGVQADYAAVDRRHVIFGDGTIVVPFSDVMEATNPLTDERIAVGSHAKTFDNARIQTDVRTWQGDHPGQNGINFVSMLTLTMHGGVVLAVTSTLEGELEAALDLCDRIAARTADGVHALVYDMAITGWAVDYLMAAHRIQMLGRVPARSREPGGGKVVNLGVEGRANAWAADLKLEPLTKKLVAPVLTNAVINQLRCGERLTRVGTSVYPKNGDENYDVVRGHYELLTAEHTLGDKSRCVHDLAMDDAALFTIDLDPYDGELVKTAYLRCESDVPIRTTTGTWGTRSLYTVPCEHGDFQLERVWAPSPARHADPKGLADPIGNRLRPTPRVDSERFQIVNDLRNRSESYNAWFKRTLPGDKHERAASLRRAGQDLDFLLAAVLNNALTWATSQGR